MNSLINLALKFLKNPLFMLRVFLTLLITKNSLERLGFLVQAQNNETYSLSLTWINSLLPRELLINEGNVQFYYYLVIICTITTVIGLFGRLSLFILASVSIIINGMVEGIGVYDHAVSLPVQIYFILAFLPGTMFFSIDRFLLSTYWKKDNLKPINPKILKLSTNLLLVILVLTYFSAGLSKLRYGGVDWLDGKTLSFYIQDKMMDYDDGKKQLLLGRDANEKDFDWKGKYHLYAHTYGNYNTSTKVRAINTWLGTNMYMMSGISIMTVLLELCGFVVFINPRLRNLYLLSVICMHSVIGLTMGLSFRYYELICLCLMDWESMYNSVLTTNNKLKAGKLKLVRLRAK